jgi:hypothetical protein
MQQLVSEFQHTLDALDSVIASRLMQMALEAARQVIGQTPVVDNTALIKQIQGLLQQEPLFSGNRSCAFIRTICSAWKRAWRNAEPARLASARRSVVTSRRLQSLCR